MNKKAQFDEISWGGVLMAILGIVFVFATSKWMLGSFLQYYSPGKRIFWGVATYLLVAVAGYLMGWRMLEG